MPYAVLLVAGLTYLVQCRASIIEARLAQSVAEEIQGR